MAFGVLEDKHLAFPSGTTVLEKSSESTDNGVSAQSPSYLKKDGDIILVPQPSDDPNDPLNWSKYKKWSITILVSVISTAVASMAAMLTPAVPLIAQEFNISSDAVNTWTIGLLTFWTGFVTFLTAPGANIIGKRPFILASSVIMVAANVWGSFATSFTELAVLRTLQGIASAPYETMVTGIISDLYFLHQRGTWLSLWGVVISVGFLIGQVISGLIIEKLGYHATFAISTSVFVILTLVAYFAVLETTYTKTRPDPIEEVKLTPKRMTRMSWMVRLDNNLPAITDQHWGRQGRRALVTDLPVLLEDSDSAIMDSKDAFVEKESYSQQLRIFRGRLSNQNIFKEMLKPFPLMVLPAVAYGAIINGLVNALLIGVGILTTIILSGPPYNLGPAQLGLINIPPFMATLLASPISGWMADSVARWMSSRNYGIFEPEYRLLLMLVGIPLSTGAYIGFGEAIARTQSIPFILMWQSIQSFASPFMIQAALSYVLDIHAEVANLAFVTIAVAKALFSFAATAVLAGLLQSLGPRTFFYGLAAVNFGVTIISLPLYIFGKRIRSSIDRTKLGKHVAQY